MSHIQKCLCWATSLILLAMGNATGLVDDATANTLFVVLPVVAVMGMRGGQSCARKLAA